MPKWFLTLALVVVAYILGVLSGVGITPGAPPAPPQYQATPTPASTDTPTAPPSPTGTPTLHTPAPTTATPTPTDTPESAREPISTPNSSAGGSYRTPDGQVISWQRVASGGIIYTAESRRFLALATATSTPTDTPTAQPSPTNTPTPHTPAPATGTSAPTASPTALPAAQRIVVSRDIWECYSDRTDLGNGDYGCYAWNRPTVEKWRSDTTVRVWATGNENYIRAFIELLDEQLAHLLNLRFEWVDDERDADLVAILGVSKSDTLSDRWPSCPEFWGCGGIVDVKSDEVRKADLIVYHLDIHEPFLNDYPTLQKMINGILLHEALHGLAPTGHPERSKVVLSVMRSAGYLTFIDKGILSLNSHPLIEPGMTMAQVREFIVFEDDLDQPEEELTSYDILERAFFTLQEVDTVRMEIRGGLSGGRCDSRFGKREWATLEIGGFDPLDDTRLAYLQDNSDGLFIFYSDDAAAAGAGGWQHWKHSSSGWQLISREELVDSTAWWVKNSKLHDTIANLLRYYSEDDVEIIDQTSDQITLRANYNPTETSVWGLENTELIFTLVIDLTSYEILNFEWTHLWHERNCGHTYMEEGRNLQYGAQIDIPSAIVANSEYPLPAIWYR